MTASMTLSDRGSQGAPRTCRCIETRLLLSRGGFCHDVREHHAPVGALRHGAYAAADADGVREHHAPVGALRRSAPAGPELGWNCQGAPRTCRCIETSDEGGGDDDDGESGSTTHL